MKLLNELYKIKSCFEYREYELEFLPDSVIYKAHFPGYPVTPGVCLIRIISELLNQGGSDSIRLEEVKNIKFLTVLDPKENPDVNLKMELPQDIIPGDEFTVKAIFYNDKQVFSKLSLVYFSSYF